MTRYGIIISHETFEFCRYKHKPLGECIYQENTSVSWVIPWYTTRNMDGTLIPTADMTKIKQNVINFGHIRCWDQCAVHILYSKISTDPGLLKIRHSHRFVAVVIQILIPFVIPLEIDRGAVLDLPKWSAYRIRKIKFDFPGGY